MKSRWKLFLLYVSIIVVGGGLVYLLVDTVMAKNTGFETKTLWDWMELLIIPLVLAGGAYFLNRSERNAEREIATDRQQEAALQAYLDRMTELILEKKLRTARNKEIRNVARTRTLAVLRGLDATRRVLYCAFFRRLDLLVKKNLLLI